MLPWVIGIAVWVMIGAAFFVVGMGAKGAAPMWYEVLIWFVFCVLFWPAFIIAGFLRV